MSLAGFTPNKQLQQFDVSYNQLTSLAEFTPNGQLEEFNVSGNQLISVLENFDVVGCAYFEAVPATASGVL